MKVSGLTRSCRSRLPNTVCDISVFWGYLVNLVNTGTLTWLHTADAPQSCFVYNSGLLGTVGKFLTLSFGLCFGDGGTEREVGFFSCFDSPVKWRQWHWSDDSRQWKLPVETDQLSVLIFSIWAHVSLSLFWYIIRNQFKTVILALM